MIILPKYINTFNPNKYKDYCENWQVRVKASGENALNLKETK